LKQKQTNNNFFHDLPLKFYKFLKFKRVWPWWRGENIPLTALPVQVHWVLSQPKVDSAPLKKLLGKSTKELTQKINLFNLIFFSNV